MLNLSRTEEHLPNALASFRNRSRTILLYAEQISLCVKLAPRSRLFTLLTFPAQISSTINSLALPFSPARLSLKITMA